MNTLTTGIDRLSGAISRTARRVGNTLGIVGAGQTNGGVKLYREDVLEIYDAYYENRQYDHLHAWDTGPEYIPVRQRRPRLIYNFPKVFSNRVTSKLVGQSVWPTFKVEGDPDTDMFIRAILNFSHLNHRMIEPMRNLLISGSVFVRFYLSMGTLRVEHYNSKYVYPTFMENGELSFVRIQFVYEDPAEEDPATKKKKQKWFRLDLGTDADIKYDNPEYVPNQPPQFEVVEQVDHGLGFVQGEWFRTAYQKHSPDGPSLIADLLGFCDELNYSLSQSSQAVSYNQDPQLIFKNMDEEDVAQLIRSSQKGWNIGKEGEASFLESSLNGVDKALEFRERIKLGLQDIARVILLDPEKIVAHAQSGRAMEVLHGPMVELIDELRPIVEERLVVLIQKMALATLIYSERGIDLPFEIPKGYAPQSLQLQTTWPPIFPQTMEDLQKKVSISSSATAANLISRETALRWIAKDFGVEDIEAEIQKINTQPQFNPFGGGF